MVKNILAIMHHFYPLCGILGASLLFFRCKSGDRSRLFLAICFGLTGIMTLIMLYVGYENLHTPMNVLQIDKLNGGLLAFLMFFFYPIEVINPRWLTLKKGLLLLSPWILLNIWLIVFKPEFRVLMLFREIIEFSGELNVCIRLLLLIMMIPCSYLLFYIPYNWSKSRASTRWILWYTMGTQGITLLYVLCLLTGSIYPFIAHKIYCVLFIFVVTYQELYIRMSVVQSAPTPVKVKKSTYAVEDEICLSINQQELWAKLVKIMEDKKPWTNPDLTSADLVSLLNTNRTTFSRLINASGYDGYSSYVNQWRIKEFLKIIKHKEIKGIQETFYDVGFRSKATALRYFRQETGMTPSEYLQQLLVDKNRQHSS